MSDQPGDSRLSHLDAEGRARMVDVSAKSDTVRTAVAAGVLRTTTQVVDLVRADDMPKADVLATARIAGIMGAKKTSELIPLCHQLALSSVDVRFGFAGDAITIEAVAKTKGPTGVEMEALTAVAVAGLTLHDMVKAVDPGAVLDNVRLLTKDGGKHGRWDRARIGEPEPAPAAFDPEPVSATGSPDPAPLRHRPATPADAETVSPRADSALPAAGNGGEHHPHHRAEPEIQRTAAVLVASTGTAAGTRVDTTGPVLVEWLRERGFLVHGPLVYPDAEIITGLADALTGNPALVITTGGTGASPTDATPEATLAILDRELPGVAEAIRRYGAEKFPLAALSRGAAGLVGRSVVVNLPGSPGGVRDGIAVLEPLLDHLLAQVAGGGRHD
ncbi:bifunctional molybdenum cofactor biosynthesis protein MoaC/MoaB [Nocardia sp. alder85J]|uniref:bifunctional molybdenum cofactor biosynthesis protein MoaC/MoaB n=1 Tax=Nocardia sp. alder85J TaxID=2862949 RepID=UPI001CD1E502|nr:bifunctional molybdenum cofactor biosynthesis protein MoaC/MoaB [Nocardia sp. alder85J]MCX4095350.1 bifunctional molybdenum cofactor biosynthesis protein MoaC/MoaB [Nocardia sp. alder85J]